jgi:glutathione synthase/RimK-type ligase-like ATP-grasp enzyme
MRENEVSIPSTWSLAEFPAVPFDFSTPKIVRPPTHAYGRNLFRVSTQEEYIHAAQMCPGGYVSEFIPKMAEYRVMVVSGRVIAVIRKTHADGAAVAWNRHSGGQFRQIKPEHWRMWTVREAVKAFKLSGLDFGAVDVIIDNESRPYILEINSAPAVRPWMQERWSKAFDFMLNHPEHLETTGRDYRAYMHPTL